MREGAEEIVRPVVTLPLRLADDCEYRILRLLDASPLGVGAFSLNDRILCDCASPSSAVSESVAASAELYAAAEDDDAESASTAADGVTAGGAEGSDDDPTTAEGSAEPGVARALFRRAAATSMSRAPRLGMKRQRLGSDAEGASLEGVLGPVEATGLHVIEASFLRSQRGMTEDRKEGLASLKLVDSMFS